MRMHNHNYYGSSRFYHDNPEEKSNFFYGLKNAVSLRMTIRLHVRVVFIYIKMYIHGYIELEPFVIF